MIKVIATDMDGTLLNNDHEISETNLKWIKKACEKGFRLMLVTGRNYLGVMEVLKKTDLVCDYILSSGAEIRDVDRKIRQTISLNHENCKFIYNISRKYPIAIMFCSELKNFMLGTMEEAENGLLDYIKYFHITSDKEELRKTKLYQRMWKRTEVVSDYEELIRTGISINKIFIVSGDVDMLAEIKKELEVNEGLAVTSSFIYNLEITDVRAQKGPVLKEYIESLGYTMNEVMVLGDSLNDYSMISMDFGATIAMENADDVIKNAAKYITKSNEEDGVAYVIEEMLKKYKFQD